MRSTVIARRVRLAVGSGVGVAVDGATGHPDVRADDEPHRYSWTTLVCRPRFVDLAPPLPFPHEPSRSALAGLYFEL